MIGLFACRKCSLLTWRLYRAMKMPKFEAAMKNIKYVSFLYHKNQIYIGGSYFQKYLLNDGLQLPTVQGVFMKLNNATRIWESKNYILKDRKLIPELEVHILFLHSFVTTFLFLRRIFFSHNSRVSSMRRSIVITQLQKHRNKMRE